MSIDKKNTSSYSTSDLQKYWRGEMSAREMHELESAALEDPFLADALEGMEMHHSSAEPADFDADLLDLRLRLQQRVARKSIRPPIRLWTRWAAAVILFVGMGSVTYYTLINRSAQKVSLAKTRTAAHGTTDSTIYPPPATSRAAARAADTSVTSSPLTTTPGRQATPKEPAALTWKREPAATTKQALAGTISDSHRIATSYKQSSTPPDNQPPALPGREAASPPLKTEYEQVTVAAAEPAKNKLPKDTADKLVAALEKKAAPGIAARQLFGNANGIGNNRSRQSIPDHLDFSGKVLDENNHPLAGASVYLNGHGDINTLTDRQGYFNLQLRPRDSVLNLNVMVAYTGYEPTSISLNNGNEFNDYNTTGNIIHLQPQPASLDELKVTGFGSSRKETMLKMAATDDEKIDSLWLNTYPVPGKLAYLSYLQTASKKVPLDSSKKGIEIISFIVNKKGKLSSFKVEQSLSPAHDSASIRLIQQGPSWKLLKGRQARTAVRISY